MTSRLPALLLCFAACASEVEPTSAALEPGVVRQAVNLTFDGGVRVTGNGLVAHLGATLASCVPGGYVAGAPGDDSVWLSPLSLRLPAPRDSGTEVVPYPVACLNLGTQGLRALVGGPNGYSLLTDGGSVLISASRVDSLDNTPGAWLALGAVQPGTVSLYPNNNVVLNNPRYTTSAMLGLGSSLAWTKRGELVVGNRSSRSASLFLPDLFVDGGAFTALPLTLPNPFPTMTTADFGAVVAAGDVYPDPGEEFIVAAPSAGRVYIFSGTLVVMTLSGGPSFGSALAVEPRDAGGGLQALWVGEPEVDTVHRFFGDSDTSFTAPNTALGSAFGQAIAVDPQGLVAIGAPRYSGPATESGAVFETVTQPPFHDGEARVCLTTTCTLSTCTPGACLGGVFCERTGAIGSSCQVNETCVSGACILSVTPDSGVPVDAGAPDASFPDAGTPDAGTPDAGTPDAGTPDAGTPDAGTPDAGTPDAGLADAGFADAGLADAGLADAGIADAGRADAGLSDAGLADAGTQDAGARDAGTQDAGAEDAGREDGGAGDAGSDKDAGAEDGGSAKDAGTSSDGGTDEAIVFRSCGCSSGGLPVLLLGLIFARRRRSLSAR